MIIDKDRFKEYVNDVYGDRYRIDSISICVVRLNRYLSAQIPEGSRYYNKAKEQGYIDIDMVNTKIVGWKLRNRDSVPVIYRNGYHGEWFTKVNMVCNFNFDNYQVWLVESRNKKLEGILE